MYAGKRSVGTHVEQPACRTRCPKEPHAQRSWHLQRSPPAQSEDLPPEVVDPESLRIRAARRGVRVITRRWAHLLSKERTLGYIATAQATASGHIYAISRVISTLRLWPHTPIRARAYDTLGEGATP